ALEAELRHRDVAAYLVEPIQGKGVHLATPEYWQAVEALCRSYGTLLICDEVQTGLGRTGKLWAHEHYGIAPDIITVSKALSGGYIPVGAMLTSDKILRGTYSSMERAMVHSTTFKNNPMAMVAGLATLSVFDDEHIVEHAAAMGDVWRTRLEELASHHEFLHVIRGRGQMIGIEFGRPTSRGARLRWRLIETTRTAMFTQTLVVPLFHRYRILTQVAADNINVIKLLPPLIAGKKEIDLFVNALDELLTEAERSSASLVEFGVTMTKSMLKRNPTSKHVTAKS
ncbi:MAG TPA: aminotransferase class III-fold pyridoxal phosphate-dependent enzyme, partial [Acidimicrobiales bacterium]